eukprot:gb/GEZJ01006787.1/.p1 GENE.gb/GEZJ01006787.1/~~gb/GEZJ01006787.1/.p1  ORF type:complete len:196 (+),score=5.86 gb/GEZJ01006787.1/:55-642(+)
MIRDTISCSSPTMHLRYPQNAFQLLRVHCIRKPPPCRNPKQWLQKVALHVLYTAITATSAKRKVHGSRFVMVRPLFNSQRHILSSSNAQFTRMYRLTKLQFSLLHSVIRGSIRRRRRRSSTVASLVPPAVMLLLTLPLLARTNYLNLFWPYGIAICNVFCIFGETLSALNRILPSINHPCSTAECAESALSTQSL